MNPRAFLSRRSIPYNAKKLANVFTHLSHLCEFCHLLSSTYSFYDESRFIALRAFSRPLVVLLEDINVRSDSHVCSSEDFPCSKLCLVDFLGLVVAGGDLARSDSLIACSELLSPDRPERAAVVLVVSSS